MSAAAAVLAVDDNATIRKAISMRLGANGFDVVTAADGPSALALVARRAFDLVILDLQMPDMRGEEVLRRLRERYSQTQLPVIVLAASNDRGDIERTLELGANDYIVKPGDLPILLARIKTQLTLRDTVARLRTQSALLRETQALHQHGGHLPGAAIIGPRGIPFDVLHDHTPMTCFALSPDGVVLHTNHFGARYLGYEARALLGRSMLDLYVPEDRAIAQENLAAARDMPGRVHRWDIRQVKKNGDVMWMRNSARAVRDSGLDLVLLTCEDIDDAYRLSEMLSFQTRHDELTHLANRKTLEARLTQVIESAHSEHTEHALAILDLDQFKLINDSCGSAAGDELLRQIAHLIKDAARKRDTIARIGSDEFAVLLEDCPVGLAQHTAENLRRVIEQHVFHWQGRSYSVSVSIGIVPVNDASDTPGEVLSLADTACYAAKDSGRNCVHTYELDNLPVQLRHGEMRWAARINQAMNENRLELVCQRIAPLGIEQDGAHFEILLRMRDEQGVLILPGEFLPAAERYNLSCRIDRWVIESVFNWLTARPLTLHEIGQVSINLSGKSIGNADMLDFILAAFAPGAVPASKICFEITETAAIADLVGATQFIERLKQCGCRFALDDFGSGFSSLAYLKQLPVDYLKIDGAFVRDMDSDSIDYAMVRSINDIGHLLGKQTVAEFVESGATIELLRTLGVDYVQGYAVGRPEPIASITSL
ncbi:MAG: EAL domain-containing protein [Gammaproteobacteria bacterium]|nr:EAL domain-containing protein [Gammaproteobacteria bacterium]